MLRHHPAIGTVLRCNYDTGFSPPEMVKQRPVIVVSPRLRKRDNLCTIVPLGSQEPEKIMPYHHKLTFDPPLPKPYDYGVHWVKADMLATVAFHRLDLLFLKKQNGSRAYDNRVIAAEDLAAIQLCIRHALGMEA
jgi:mRNA interferase MazF